jgi:hypothetical protein
MTVNLSLEMITVIGAILDRTPVNTLRAVTMTDGSYEVDGIDALDLFQGLRAEAQLLYRGVKL